MLTVAYYFLQVMLCSAAMMGYYTLVLRNKRFHQYNRFYLLGVAILPWLMPLVKIEINKPKEELSIPIQLFSVIADTNSEFEKTVASNGFQFTWQTLLAVIYIAISCTFFVALIIALVKIYKLLKTNACKHLDDVYLVLTQAHGTPFSFFKFIFWHTDIDVNTATGKQMLRHELTHVQEKHSADKLLIQIVLIMGWPNPIFWLLKRELETIHEFIADNKTIDNGDTAALAIMLLAAAYPQQRFALTNPFFYSPIKRRIAMLTNNKNPRFSYARRLVVLPLLVTITLLFAFRKKETQPITISVASALENVVGTITNKSIDNTDNIIDNAKLLKTYTVVIDAGHGGADAGAPGIDGKSFEKDIALSIAKLVKAQNANANINIVLTRDNDVFMSPQERVTYVNKLGADLFVSLHCNSADPIKTSNGYKANPTRGYEVVLPTKERVDMEDCKLLASSINSVFNSSSFSVGQVVQKQRGVWVLQATNCPATLVECGYISNTEDLKVLKNTANQQEIATNILKGIETYLVSKEKGVSVIGMDTLPRKNDYISNVNTDIIENDENRNKSIVNLFDTISRSKIKLEDVPNDAIIIYNQKQISKSELEVLYSKSGWGKKLYSYEISEYFLKKYGYKARNGVILFDDAQPLIIIDGNKMPFDRINKIEPNRIKNINVLKDRNAFEKYGEEAKNGVLEIFLKKDASDTIFEISKDGTFSNFKFNSNTSNTISDSYKKNGTMRILGKDTVYTHVKIDAEFPGGQAAWAKYLERNLHLPDEAKTKHAPIGKYTVTVTFTVNIDGTLSNISTTNNPGYGMANAAVELIAKGPKWLVAVDNSKRVASVVKREIVFIVDEL